VGELFAQVASTLDERREARKESMEDRTETVADMANNSDEQWLLWVDYNDESTMLHKKVNDSVEVKGSDDPEFKAQASLDFADGKIHALVSKSSIFGFGVNYQGIHNMVFCGLSDSYERFYQAIRRCWRFGQQKEVNVYIVLSERELSVLENIKKKQKLMEEMQHNMTALMKDVIISELHHTTRIIDEYNPQEKMEVPSWM
jgi:superfamily II DNA helicase RecQ